jgi:hypothetical protein
VWGERLFIVAVGMLLVPNIVRHVAFIYEQHWDDPGLRKKWADPIIAAQMVKDFVPEDARIIGPQAPIIAYLSGRSVYMQKELFSAHENPINYPKRVAAKGIEYMILPATKYNHSEPIMAQLVERGVIVPTARVTRDSGLTLAMVDIVVPPEGKDWRTNPIANHQWVTTTQRGPTSDQVRRMARLRREAAEARARREKLELKQKLEAKRVREANAAKLAKAAKERQAQLAAKKAREAKLAREAKARQAANARRKRLQKLQQQTTQPSATPQAAPATQPVSLRWEHREPGRSVILRYSEGSSKSDRARTFAARSFGIPQDDHARPEPQVEPFCLIIRLVSDPPKVVWRSAWIALRDGEGSRSMARLVFMPVALPLRQQGACEGLPDRSVIL